MHRRSGSPGHERLDRTARADAVPDHDRLVRARSRLAIGNGGRARESGDASGALPRPRGRRPRADVRRSRPRRANDPRDDARGLRDRGASEIRLARVGKLPSSGLERGFRAGTCLATVHGMLYRTAAPTPPRLLLRIAGAGAVVGAVACSSTGAHGLVPSPVSTSPDDAADQSDADIGPVATGLLPNPCGAGPCGFIASP